MKALRSTSSVSIKHSTVRRSLVNQKGFARSAHRTAELNIDRRRPEVQSSISVNARRHPRAIRSDSSVRHMSSNSSFPFIVAFYDPKIRAEDGEGRTLSDILRFSNNEVEYFHDFIQYLFPLPEPSPINPEAPTVTKDVRDAFLGRPELQQELRRSLQRMLTFYGFTIDSSSSIVPGESFEERSKATWRKRMDHNHLRITRIIRALRVLGLEQDAMAFYHALLASDESNQVGSRTVMFWKRAAERGLHLAPQQDDEAATGVKWLKDK